jgi:hypothetical protein
MTPPNAMIGPSVTAKAREVERQRNAKAEWPYQWIYPPGVAIPVSIGLQPTVPGVATAGVAMPAIGDQVEVCEYTVPNGFAFWLREVIAEARAAGVPSLPFAPGDGSVFWTLDVDQPLGAVFPTGAPVKDFGQVQVPLGAWEIGCRFPLDMPILFEARHTLRWKFTNVSNDTDDVWISCGLFGFLVPEDQA